jgi:hypothetical protein
VNILRAVTLIQLLLYIINIESRLKIITAIYYKTFHVPVTVGLYVL